MIRGCRRQERYRTPRQETFGRAAWHGQATRATTPNESALMELMLLDHRFLAPLSYLSGLRGDVPRPSILGTNRERSSLRKGPLHPAPPPRGGPDGLRSTISGADEAH